MFYNGHSIAIWLLILPRALSWRQRADHRCSPIWWRLCGGGPCFGREKRNRLVHHQPISDDWFSCEASWIYKRPNRHITVQICSIVWCMSLNTTLYSCKCSCIIQRIFKREKYSYLQMISEKMRRVEIINKFLNLGCNMCFSAEGRTRRNGPRGEVDHPCHFFSIML